jgi:hypothetical protein
MPSAGTRRVIILRGGMRRTDGRGDRGPMAMPADPMTMLRSRSYLGLLVLAAILGVPVSAVA